MEQGEWARLLARARELEARLERARLWRREQAAEEDIDGRIQNLDNFYHWCASRVLTLDRDA